MRAYESKKDLHLVYPACCNADACITQWRPYPIESCPPDVLAQALETAKEKP